jgi:hypothetical protein
MFLRWTRYRDKAGRVRLYARLLSSRRVGGKVRHISDGSLRVIVQAGIALDEQFRRDLWTRLDHYIEHRSPRERANIERVFAAEMGPRPPPTAFARALHAVLSRTQVARSSEKSKSLE